MQLEDYLAQNDICVCCQPLPASVRGFMVRCGAGYCVFLNSSYPEETQRRALLHELAHIERGDDSSALPVSVIERQMHHTP